MRKIIVIKESGEIPEGAKYLYTVEKEEKVGDKRIKHEGLFIIREGTVAVMGKVIYHYYEVEE